LKKIIFDIKVIDNVRLNTGDFISLPSYERDKLKLLKGHQEFGLHNYFTKKSEYITFLRDPIERIISYFFYFKRRPNHRLYKLNLFNDEMSLYDFVTKVKAGDINNGQIRFISGIADKKEFMLEKAIENIERHFSFVGTLEKFDESLIILQKMYNWSSPYYKISNKTEGRPKLSIIDNKTVEAIKNLNSEDIYLYNLISNKLDILIQNESMLKQKIFMMHAMSKIHMAKNKSREEVIRLMPTVCKNALKRILH
jgi:hypothetical protein